MRKQLDPYTLRRAASILLRHRNELRDQQQEDAGYLSGYGDAAHALRNMAHEMAPLTKTPKAARKRNG